ncbi:MAG: hypothetical protein ACHQ50_07525 [Fimbriimonadales bacterium]
MAKKNEAFWEAYENAGLCRATLAKNLEFSMSARVERGIRGISMFRGIPDIDHIAISFRISRRDLWSDEFL